MLVVNSDAEPLEAVDAVGPSRKKTPPCTVLEPAAEHEGRHDPCHELPVASNPLLSITDPARGCTAPFSNASVGIPAQTARSLTGFPVFFLGPTRRGSRWEWRGPREFGLPRLDLPDELGPGPFHHDPGHLTHLERKTSFFIRGSCDEVNQFFSSILKRTTNHFGRFPRFLAEPVDCVESPMTHHFALARRRRLTIRPNPNAALPPVPSVSEESKPGRHGDLRLKGLNRRSGPSGSNFVPRSAPTSGTANGSGKKSRRGQAVVPT